MSTCWEKVEKCDGVYFSDTLHICKINDTQFAVSKWQRISIYDTSKNKWNHNEIESVTSKSDIAYDTNSKKICMTSDGRLTIMSMNNSSLKEEYFSQNLTSNSHIYCINGVIHCIGGSTDDEDDDDDDVDDGFKSHYIILVVFYQKMSDMLLLWVV